MRILDTATRQAIQTVIDANMAELSKITGFVEAEPGFPLIDGAIRKEPSIIVFVAQKKPTMHLLPEERAPRQITTMLSALGQPPPFAFTHLRALPPRKSQSKCHSA